MTEWSEVTPVPMTVAPSPAGTSYTAVYVSLPMALTPAGQRSVDEMQASEVWACQVVTPHGRWRFRLDGSVVVDRFGFDTTPLQLAVSDDE